jgi:hypothetical protein
LSAVHERPFGNVPQLCVVALQVLVPEQVLLSGGVHGGPKQLPVELHLNGSH